MTEIRPGLHRFVAPLGERFVALYLFVGSEASLLFDTGVRESVTETLLPALAAEGIDPGTIRWAINSHCDFDHTGGNGALRAALPAVELLAHRLDRELTEDVERLIAERYGEFADPDGFDDPPETTATVRADSDLVRLDGELVGGEVFDLGDRTVRVVHVPGHSPGHLAIWDEANGAIAISDAVLGRTVPTADGQPAFPPTYRDTADYLDSIERVRAFNAELLLTAHYPIYEGAAATEFLDDSARYVAEIDEAVLAVLAGANGPVSTLDIIRTAGSALGPWPAAALDYAIFPVTGNLERLRDQGAVRESMLHGRRSWELAR
ncbi:MAG: MBL fold metallo-hydrolase [Leucobacter sp.]|nr:MBL fold metallo-hydrolase [Leucobacter sp.]